MFFEFDTYNLFYLCYMGLYVLFLFFFLWDLNGDIQDI